MKTARQMLAAAPIVCIILMCRTSAQIIELSTDDIIRDAVYYAEPGSEITLADGVYHVHDIIQVRNPGITIRSKSGNREAVILDGNGAGTPLSRSNFVAEVLQIRASDVTIENLTIRYAATHGIHASGAADHTIRNLRLRNLHVYDCGEQIIKVNSNGNKNNLHWVDSGLIENCLIEFIDNSVMRDMGAYFYTGGVDVHGGRNWVIRHTTFKNIWRENKMMEHAVHFWSRSRNSLVENNTFINCWRAIGFGMKTSESGLIRSYEDHAGEDPYYDHVGGMIRNNSVYNDLDHRLETGIELMNVLDVEVYHNTVLSIAEPFNSIEYRWPDTRVTIINNLCSHRIMRRNEAQGHLAANIEQAANNWFVNSEEGDFHLSETATSAIDQGVVLEDRKAGLDIDGELRGDSPDIGADERDGVETVMTARVRRRIKTISSVRVYDCLGRTGPFFAKQRAASSVQIIVYPQRSRRGSKQIHVSGDF